MVSGLLSAVCQRRLGRSIVAVVGCGQYGGSRGCPRLPNEIKPSDFPRPFIVKIFSQLMHTCGFCIWPPAKTRVENCRVVTSNEEPEVKVQPHEGAPIGEERGQNKPKNLDYAGGDSISNAVNRKGLFGLMKDPGWRPRGLKTLRQLLKAIRQPPFLNMETFDDIRFLRDWANPDGEASRRHGDLVHLDVVRTSVSTKEGGTTNVFAHGSIAKMRTKPEGLGIVTVRFFSHGAILGLACQLSESKPKAIAKDANGARLISFKQGRSRPRPTATQC